MEYGLLASAVVMGFLGSWHCGIMCGPLVCNFKKQTDFFSYHLGRLVSYLFMGLLLFYGLQYFTQTDSRPIKLIVSFALGSLLILFGLNQLGLFAPTKAQRQANSILLKAQFWILKRTRHIADKFPIVLGLLTGFFPCSWLYSFLLLASQMKTLPMSMAIIFIFWATSLPAFLVFTGFMQVLIQRSPTRYQKISGLVLILAGLLSIIGHWSSILSL